MSSICSGGVLRSFAIKSRAYRCSHVSLRVRSFTLPLTGSDFGTPQSRTTFYLSFAVSGTRQLSMRRSETLGHLKPAAHCFDR
jgi:hypothetical protein